ncbi:TetR family transcriptional regulator [Actinoplanes regularis]|uniref:Transcriptional regulator, TetR family n=1 Tax=Actinoplanes regularis TaxID=52697 RepID=A0A239DWN5_9ACTN|nr:TetR family transcriptional regulator [Actinoplanes regularis]GIE88998.1 TetR family transcriptional regulator [Actinoplanes regularis]SNS36112.1 transcriptional regulator, TetR family [Actinoplanes regularis]
MRRTAEDAAATRVALLDAALAVIARDGYPATRLEEVAKHAGVTRGALYHHFSGKAELFDAAVAARWAEVAVEVFGDLDGTEPALRRLERFVAGYARRARSEPRFRELLTVVVLRTGSRPELAPGLREKQQATDLWLEALLPTLAEAEAAGELRAGLDARAAAGDVLTALYGVTVLCALPDGADTGLVDAGRLARTIVRGLGR